MSELERNTTRWWAVLGLVGCAIGLIGGFVLSALLWVGLGVALLSLIVLFVRLESNPADSKIYTPQPTASAETSSSVTGQLQVTSVEIGMAVEAIESVTKTQTQGTEEQTRVISEMRSMLEEFLELSDHTSAQAQQVTTMGQQLTVTAEAGQTAIQAATDVMDQIRKQVAVIAETIATLARLTRRIETIITSVGEIATQSNLLALNASIEAARAGTHGRGFAVVADEVRVLAGQSTDAAGEVRTLLREVQSAITETIDATQAGMTEVNRGVLQTRRASEVIQQISGEVIHANDMTQAIHEVIKRQVEGLEMITMNVEQMNHVTRQNSQEMQVINTVSANLTRLSGELRRVLAPVSSDGQQETAAHTV